MRGPKLVTGLLVMGIAVPLILFYLLNLENPRQLVTIAIVTFFSWGIADVCSEILIRPRLSGRSPKDALRDWEQRKKDRTSGSASE
jgi:hypothetical protein